MSGDHHVIRADQLAAPLQLGSQWTIVSGGGKVEGMYWKALQECIEDLAIVRLAGAFGDAVFDLGQHDRGQ